MPNTIVQQAVQAVSAKAAALPFITRMQQQLLQHTAAVNQPPCSRLTNKGIPLEMAFVWPHYQVRCTVDIDMYSNPQQRFAKSLQTIAACGYKAALHTAAGLIEQQLHANPAAFRYGAWLGFRDGRDYPKLYAEIPPALNNDAQFTQLLPPPPAATGVTAQAVMLGWQPGSDECEVYYRVAYLHPVHLRELLHYYGLPQRALEIQDWCERLLQRKIRAQFPSADTGFSVSFSATGTPEAFTLYAFAWSLLGMDHRILAHITQLGKAEQWNMEQYHALAAPLAAPRMDVNTYHGMVGFVNAHQAPVQFTAGISPFLYPQNNSYVA